MGQCNKIHFMINSQTAFKRSSEGGGGQDICEDRDHKVACLLVRINNPTQWNTFRKRILHKVQYRLPLGNRTSETEQGPRILDLRTQLRIATWNVLTIKQTESASLLSDANATFSAESRKFSRPPVTGNSFVDIHKRWKTLGHQHSNGLLHCRYMIPTQENSPLDLVL